MDLAVTQHGRADAPSVVLLHGLGTTGWMWERIVPLLEADLHCLVVDLPGHGASRNRRWVSLDDTADAVAGVIRSRATAGTAALAGLSLGGYVAAVLAVRAGDIVPSALISGVNVLPFPRPGLMRLAGRVLAPFVTSGPLLRANARALRVPDEDVADYVAAARTLRRGTYTAVGAELGTFVAPSGAGSSGTRVLVTAGEREHDLIRRSLPVLAGAYPSGSARIVPGLGHAWPGEDPGLFADVLRAQVRGAELPGRLPPPTAAGISPEA